MRFHFYPKTIQDNWILRMRQARIVLVSFHVYTDRCGDDGEAEQGEASEGQGEASTYHIGSPPPGLESGDDTLEADIQATASLPTKAEHIRMLPHVVSNADLSRACPWSGRASEDNRGMADLLDTEANDD